MSQNVEEKSKGPSAGLKTVASLSGYIAVVVGYVAVFEGGFIDVLNQFILFEYTIPQLVFLTLVVVGISIIAYEIWAGVRRITDLPRDLSEYLQDTTGATDAELKRFAKKSFDKAKKKVVGAVVVGGKYPTPEELRDAVREELGLVKITRVPAPPLIPKKAKVFRVAPVMAAFPIQEEVAGNLPVEILPAREASSKGAVLVNKGFAARVGLAVGALCTSVVVLWLVRYVMAG